MSEIKHVTVVGAGVMGSAIAAHIANAGLPVLLLDIVPKDAKDRSTIARSAIAKLLKTDPAPLMHPSKAKLITPGNLEDDLEKVSESDWIIEAIIERLGIKQSLYEKLDKVRKAGSIVSSNTSTIPLGVLMDGMPKKLENDFLISHFFNPPRYMRLLELVGGEKTSPAALETVRAFADARLGKGVVPCKDTPGFIANRLGIFWIECGLNATIDAGLSIEDADAVIAQAFKTPKTGLFALMDMVGLDLMPHVQSSMLDLLPESDRLHAIHQDHTFVQKMIDDGYTGRKGKGGFYRLNRADGKKVKEARDFASGDYRKADKSKLDSVKVGRKKGPRALIEKDDKGSRFAWKVLSEVLVYAASLVPEIADDITHVDEAMRLGYNWKLGPFELIDLLGTEWFAARLKADGREVPPLIAAAAGRPFYRIHLGRAQRLGLDGEYADITRPEGVLMLDDVKRRGPPVLKNWSASVWDLGDGVLCLEFTSKMNSLNYLILKMIDKCAALIPGKYKALVIYNDGRNFSVGANLLMLLIAAKLRAWFFIEGILRQGQNSYRGLKYAPFPVVGAPSGMALGGGCEVLLHCDKVQAHAESYIGLVEVGAGIIPGWGGCKEMLQRWFFDKKRDKGPMPPVIKAFETISTARVAKSAFEAKSLLFLREHDEITMNRDRLLADAKAAALALVEGYQPPEPLTIALPGPSAKAAMTLAVNGFHASGKATKHDVTVSLALADALSGGDTDFNETLSEDDLLALERKHFMRLARLPASHARVTSLLKTGKPLRN